MKSASIDLQDLYPDVQFLLLDGEPHNADYTVYRSADNVYSIMYREEQAGFLAGYGAVMEGKRSLGFLGGMELPAVRRYGYGFIQGAEQAAKDSNLQKGAIEIRFAYAGQFVADDGLTAMMRMWYSGGIESVFTCGGSIYASAVTAAEECGGTVIGVDVDQSGASPAILTSAEKELAWSVESALAALYKNGGVWPENMAGKTALLGADSGSVGLPNGEAWRFKNWTQAEYQTLYKRLSAGEITVSDDIDHMPETIYCSVEEVESWGW